MLRSDLVDVVNSGRAWAFVASGVSEDAAYPSWSGLVARLVGETELRDAILLDKRYQTSLRERDYIQCLSRIEAIAGRAYINDQCKQIFRSYPISAPIAQRLSDWPFAGYVTSNYDPLLEWCLEQTNEPGWISVGNTPDEVRKVSGDPRDVVWHVHGGAALPDDRSRLVVTEADYDDLYLEGSAVERQLRALLTQNRFIFVGFGFKDPELQRLIKITARYTSPTSPIYAFLALDDGDDEQSLRLEFLERFNVDVIPYRVVGGSHQALADLLRMYSAMILGRSLKFGEPRRACPSYDPETTGLLVYNRMVLGGAGGVGADTTNSLLKARILALARFRGQVSTGDVLAELGERIEVMRGPEAATEARQSAEQLIAQALHELESAGLIATSRDGAVIASTTTGEEFTSEQAGTADRLAAQFAASLASRVSSVAEGANQKAIDGIATVAKGFLESCVSERALGVAMVWHSSEEDFQKYHMVALLQELPKHAQQLANIEEARLLVDVILAVLAHPSDSESVYLGSLMQAQFGLHLLGADPSALAARSASLSSTAFLLDSTTLIPYLADHSTGNAAAKQLVDQIRLVGATPITTDLLSLEVAEHARWALRALGKRTPIASLQGMALAVGRAGAHDNVFIDGCISDAAAGGSLDLGPVSESHLRRPAWPRSHERGLQRSAVAVGNSSEVVCSVGGIRK
jgi:SIR2-like domain